MIGLRLRLLRRLGKNITDAQLARALSSRPAGYPLGVPIPHPAPVVGESLYRRLDPRPEPSFTPAPPTRPIAGCAPAEAVAASRARAVRPFISAGAPKTLLFDKLAAEMPLALSAGDAARRLAPDTEPGCDVELYSAPGWTTAVTALRIERGELDDWHAGVEQGLGRNAAEEATALRHSRQSVAEGWRKFCLAVGHPEWTDPGLRRIHELVMQDRKGTGPQRAAVGGAA